MRIMLEIEDYNGNTLGFIKFNSDDEIDINKMDLVDFDVADVEGNYNLQHIRIQRTERD